MPRMSEYAVSSLLLKFFPYQPTPSQKELIQRLGSFLYSFEKDDLFILRGYAGTGKTTVVSALVDVIPVIRKKFMLLAPTGRAAKVLASYTGKRAYTIHKKIYRTYSRGDGSVVLALMDNLHEDTLFIVDEASMIHYDIIAGDYSLFSTRNLLEDLFQYVKNGRNCKLLFIGDSAQLPPVGLHLSPALDPEFLKKRYQVTIHQAALKDVVRQAEDSGILFNATMIRNKISEGDMKPPFFTLGIQPDIRRINGLELEDELHTMYDRYGHEETIVITRSNKRANIFNREIRNRILYRDSEIAAGDLLMVVRNNYYWLEQRSRAGFIANGDMIEVLQLKRYYELYGFKFADAVIRLLDYPDEKEFEVKILIDTLHIDTASLSQTDHRKIFDAVMGDYQDIPSRSHRIEKVRNNPFYNSLQVKFAYALTCHKTQGGQWRAVFVDQGYLTDDMINTDYMRWLYTALTRATERLFLVNFNDSFFS